MPRVRARITVCDVSPPLFSTSPSSRLLLISVAASEGVMSSATRMTWPGGGAGGGAAFFQVGDQAVQHVGDVVALGLEREVGDGVEYFQVFFFDLLDGPFGLDQPVLDGVA